MFQLRLIPSIVFLAQLFAITPCPSPSTTAFSFSNGYRFTDRYYLGHSIYFVPLPRFIHRNVSRERTGLENRKMNQKLEYGSSIVNPLSLSEIN